MKSNTPRRVFLSAVGAAVIAGSCTPKPKPRPTPVPNKPIAGSMPMRQLGRTGVQVSLLGIGGYHLGSAKTESEAIRIVHHAIEHGVTFLDNCWDYHDGESERRMGKALQGGYRERVFLMTKTDGQVKEVAAKQLDESLKRLGTDHIQCGKREGVPALLHEHARRRGNHRV